MTGTVDQAIEAYARATSTPLAPQWSSGLRGINLPHGDDALPAATAALGWAPAREIGGRPRADQFPLLVHDSLTGWATVRQWHSDDTMLLAGERGTLPYSDDQRFFLLDLPDPLAADGGKAISVIWRAIRHRKQALVMAGIATIFANLLTLATSLYSMQLYDRVIPLASFDTLLVLTVGVCFALMLDLALRSLRALLIESEAQEIDAEVSEFFFARAQAIRLDSRPPGIGTMAAQLRGQEQVRQVLSSGSVFLLADLPFALFFIAVIAMIGGRLALVPIISLPIALGLAFGLSRIIRRAADRAQISGNRKNGMLVEALDAAETVKANRGGWHMIGRWNRLIRDIQHYEEPVKRASALAASLFSTLQQVSYIAIMAWGAYLTAEGNMTTGGLLACSIIAGRISGPLVAQLPSLIVQWGYARSSLKALDGIMALPLETSSASGALRPEAIEGGYQLNGVSFAYAGANRTALDMGTLTIRPGERIAVIGGIGSGKTTLLKLLAGLYAPQSGSLLMGGLDLSQIAEDIARQHIGYLPQGARLVNGTLRDNLTMGLGDLSDAEIMEVARSTRLDQLVANAKDGLAFPIQEGGLGLSVGQRSLVGINRMVHAKPGVWLLDEPTASLDSATEAAVLSAIDKALGPKDILIMVTHKPQLLSRFDRIILMGDGKVLRDGPAKEILGQLFTRAKVPTEKVDDGNVHLTTQGSANKQGSRKVS